MKKNWLTPEFEKLSIEETENFIKPTAESDGKYQSNGDPLDGYECAIECS